MADDLETRAEPAEPEKVLSTGQVAALAGLAGATGAWLAQEILDRREAARRRATPTGRLLEAVGNVDRATEDARKALSSRVDTLPSPEVVASVVRELSKHPETRRLVKEAQARSRDVRDVSEASARHFAKQAAPVTQRASDEIAHAFRTGGERATHTGQQLAKTAVAVLSEQSHRLADRARELGEDAPETVRDIAHDLPAIARKESRDVGKRLEPALARAMSVAGNQTRNLASHLGDAVERVQSHSDDAGLSSDNVGKVMGENVSKFLEAGQEFVGQTRRDLGPAASSLLEERVERTRQSTSGAADAAAGFGRDSLATLIWTAISAIVIYFGILDEQQRAKVRSLINTVFNSGKEIVRDLQGEDEQFS